MRPVDKKLDVRGKTNEIRDVHLLIDMTEKCNHRCIMCKHAWSPTMHGEIPAQFLDPGLFFKIINELRYSRMQVVSMDPIWAGESLMHPQFKEMIAYFFAANKKNKLCKGTVINTNGVFLDKETTDIFLDYGAFVQEHSRQGYYFRLYFSLDAIRPATYEKVHNTPAVGLERVVENIHYFLEARARRGLLVPNANFVFIVMEENQREAAFFKRRWSDFLKKIGCRFEVTPTWPLKTDRDAIYFRQLICPDIQKAIRLHRKVCARIGLAEPGRSGRTVVPPSASRRICAAPWRTPNIQASGIVTPCCRDIELTLNLGDIRNGSLEEVWFGEKAQKLRRAHITGDLTSYPVCATCVEPEGEIQQAEAESFVF